MSLNSNRSLTTRWSRRRGTDARALRLSADRYTGTGHMQPNHICERFVALMPPGVVLCALGASMCGGGAADGRAGDVSLARMELRYD